VGENHRYHQCFTIWSCGCWSHTTIGWGHSQTTGSSTPFRASKFPSCPSFCSNWHSLGLSEKKKGALILCYNLASSASWHGLRIGHSSVFWLLRVGHSSIEYWLGLRVSQSGKFDYTCFDQCPSCFIIPGLGFGMPIGGLGALRFLQVDFVINQLTSPCRQVIYWNVESWNSGNTLPWAGNHPKTILAWFHQPPTLSLFGFILPYCCHDPEWRP